MRLFIWLSFILLLSPLFSQTCLTGWNYYLPVVLENNTGQTLTDFQARFTLDGGALTSGGKLLASGDDIRVVDTLCQPVPFSFNPSQTSGNLDIWVRIGSLAPGAKQALRVYYGNSSATTAADGDAVFEFFDDFSGSVPDTAKWKTVGAYSIWRIRDGAMDYSGSNDGATGSMFKYVRAKKAFSSPVIYDIRISQHDNGPLGFVGNRSAIERYLLRYYRTNNDTLNIPAIMSDTTSGGSAVVTNWPNVVVRRFVFQELSVFARINANQHLVIDSLINYSEPNATVTGYEFPFFDMDSAYFLISSFGQGFTCKLDHIQVRKPLPLPDFSLGTEVMQGPNSISRPVALQVMVMPNPFSGQFEIRTELPVQTVSVYSIQGQEVYRQEGNETTIDLHDLAGGPYLLQVFFATGQTARQMIRKN
jgi:hypothetical protein